MATQDTKTMTDGTNDKKKVRCPCLVINVSDSKLNITMIGCL